MNMVTENMNNIKNNVIASVANNKGYKRLYQAKLDKIRNPSKGLDSLDLT
jgi:hypothetical protein